MTINQQKISNRRNERALDEKTVLKQISSFIRKLPTYEGAHILQQYSRQLDLSYAETLITAAKRYFGEAFKQWSKYQLALQIPITNFINNVYSKIHHSKLLCLQNAFAPLLNNYTKTTKKKPILHNLQQTRLQSTDNVMKNFIKKKEGQLKNQKQAEVQKDKPFRRGNDLVTQLANKQQIEKLELALRPEINFGQNTAQSRISCWKQLYFKINFMYSNFFLIFSPILRQKIGLDLAKTIKNQPNNEQKQLQTTPQWKLLQLEQTLYTNYRDCACCLSYVQQNQDLSFPPYPQPVSFFGEIKWHGDMQKELTEQMVAYLNGKGGVILVGCSRGKYNQIVPNIAVTQQTTKDQIQSKLRTYVESISPSVQLKRHIDFIFIPVAVNRNKKQQMKPTWISGTYILKIVVTPIEPQNTYYYNYNKLIHYAKHTHYSNVSLKEEEIYEFMKNKYFQFNLKIQGGLRERGNIVPVVYKHNGPCRGAEKGIPEYGQGLLHQDNQGDYKEDNGITNPLLAERFGYKSVSLLVADRQAVPEIKRIFSQVQKIETVIEVAFPQLQFRLSNNTWLVWHNVKFEKLMTGIKKQTNALKQKNNKKPVLLISTCKDLKSLGQQYFSDDTIENIISFALKHANEKVQHKFIEEYEYFKCPSIITAVLLYFYIAHYQKTKCVFEKIPVGSGNHKHTRPSAAKIPSISAKKQAPNRARYDDEDQTFDDKQGRGRNILYQQKAIDYTIESNNSKYQQRQKDKKKIKPRQKRQNRDNQHSEYPEVDKDSYENQKEPTFIISTYDAAYNVLNYFDNGFVYCYTQDRVLIGSRTYEQVELEYVIALHNMQNVQHIQYPQ